MKRIGLDWKFFLTIAVGIIGLAIPVYFWQADLTAHSLTIRFISSSTLQAPAEAGIQDLRITVNGFQIASPYISSFVLENTGSKPISSADFETPIELSTRNDSTLITAQITKSSPEDIPAKIMIVNGKLNISPFLSNPSDQITVTIVSSGALDLAPKARIAGVKNITYEDATQKKARPVPAIGFAAVFVCAFTLYIYFLTGAPLSSHLMISPILRVFTGFFMLSGGLVYSGKFTDLLGKTTTAYALLALLSIGALVLGFLLKRRNRYRYSS